MAISARILDEAARQSAADLGCPKQALFASRNSCLAAQVRPECARSWLPARPLFHMVSYGSCVVAQTAPALEQDTSRMLAGSGPAWKYFQPEYTNYIAHELAAAGYAVYLALDTCFLPSESCTDPLSGADAVFRVLMPPDFAGLYVPEWENALSPERPRLDVFGVGAYINGTLAGLAACSEETPVMWQIGVDVLPEYRKRGLAAHLVRRLAAAAMESGHVPYYTVAAANIASLRTAAAAGFLPAWTQLTAVPMQQEQQPPAR